jgi:hypothetical protein
MEGSKNKNRTPAIQKSSKNRRFKSIPFAHKERNIV